MKNLITILALVIILAYPACATVSDTNSPVKVYTSGTATSYTIPFDYIDDEDVVVTLVNATTGAETAQTLDVDYTIVDETVTYTTAPGAAYKVVLRRATPYTQEASFSAGEAPPLSTYESAYDKATMLLQDLNERLRRALLLPDSTATTDVIWPDLALNAGKLVRINTDGDGLEAIATVAAGSALDVTAYCDAADLAELHQYQTTSGLTVSDITALHSMVTTSGITVSDATILHDHAADLDGATATPTASKIAKFDASGIMKGAELNMTGYSHVSEASSTKDIALGSASAGDVILVTAKAYINGTSVTLPKGKLSQVGTGSATFTDGNSIDVVYPMSQVNSTSHYGLVTTLIFVNGPGTITIRNTLSQTGGTGVTYSNGLSAFFLKKG